MGTITSGIGLVSGLNTSDIITKLLAIDQEPQQLVQNDVTQLTNQQVAFQTISAQLLALKLDSDNLTQANSFSNNTATSSDPNSATATADATASPGTYDFTVGQLVSTQQDISKGFGDTSSTPVGAGNLNFDFGAAELNTDTSLSSLNGGDGVTRGSIRITDRSGASTVVDLSKALTVGDVVDAINSSSGINVTASVNGDGLQLTDNTGASTAALTVANVGSNGTATGLGLTTAASGATLTGSNINTIGADTALASLNDGNGVRINGVTSDFHINRQDGTGFDVTLGNAKTVGDVLAKINSASGGNVTATIDDAGTGIKLVDSSANNGSTFSVAASTSQAAADLGILGSANGGGGTEIDGSRVIASLDSKLVKNLNGGKGADLGQISITNRAGHSTTIDLSGAQSVSDILSTINSSGAGVNAVLNNSGNGITLNDTTGSAASNLIVTDVTGTGASDLGLAGNVASSTVGTGNLNVRFISEATSLTSLNGGAGVALGNIRITDSRGVSAVVNLSNATTVQSVLDNINSRGLQINAKINDNGNGIIIQDTGSGGSAIQVAEDGSTTAHDLGILGTAATAGSSIDGSFDKSIAIDSTDTLTDVVNKINNSGLNVKASIVNDGSAANPYRLSIQATKTGSSGAFVFDDGGLNLGVSTLVKAKNAVVFYGSTDPSKAVAITSPTNTLTSLIPGATINLLSATTGPVEVSITRDDSSVVTAVQKFATDFNSAITTINGYDTYDPTTQTAGLLLGDPTIENIKSSLFSLLNSSDGDLKTQFQSLAAIGVTVGANSSLNVDPTVLGNALAQNHDAVANLFTFQTTGKDAQGNTTTTAAGIGVKISNLLSHLTDSTTGTITTQLNTIASQITADNTTIANYTTQLNAKKAVLQEQFNNMELALSQLQSQGSTLSSLTGLSTSSSSGSSSSSSSSTKTS